MIRIWIYKLLVKYYGYCMHAWFNSFYETRNQKSLDWANHYKDKLWKTKKKLDAYRYYISLRRL